MYKRRLGTLGFLVLALFGIFYLGSLGVASAADYTPATVEPVTIPLWGPTWDHSPVTYSVNAGRGVTQVAVDQVEQAVDDWNHAIATIAGALAAFLVLAPDGSKGDIAIRPKKSGGRVQGQALCKSEGGFFTNCKVNVSGGAFGSPNPDGTVLSIAIQEIGHALGLLHAQGDAATQDVMYGTLQDPPNTVISFCDLDGWAAVMAWDLTDSEPAAPTGTFVSCGVVTPPPPPDEGGDPANVLVTTDFSFYSNRETVNITVTVTDDTNSHVPGAAVTLTLTTASGRTLGASGETDADGVKKFRYKVNSKRDGVGLYTLDAEACKNDTCAVGDNSFTVN